jgi:AcrR family transcriptional regulator
MGRRSDHSRKELREMIVAEGHRQISEVGFSRFSAREVAKRIGYSIGTIYNVFGSYDHLILAINGRTLDLWRAYVAKELADETDDRLKRMIAAYFEFAFRNHHAWRAVYDFHLPEGTEAPEAYRTKVTAIFDIAVAEVASSLPADCQEQAAPLTRSLLATVHGHCMFALSGTFDILGETDPVAAALARVRDAIDAAG